MKGCRTNLLVLQPNTFVSRGVERGVNLKSLSDILGHADVRTTMQGYAHPSMDLKRMHIEKTSSEVDECQIGKKP